jgi:hypothetical protein
MAGIRTCDEVRNTHRDPGAKSHHFIPVDTNRSLIQSGNLRHRPVRKSMSMRRRHPLTDEATRQALIVLWEASDRVCGKRLKALFPILVPALERNGHLTLNAEIRPKLLNMSAATIDRLLRDIRTVAGNRRRRKMPTALRKSVPIHTFADWNDPMAGFMEIDLVSHCGDVAAGSFAHTLTLTDIASGWTECLPLLFRDSNLVVEAIDGLRRSLPFRLAGIDIDNGGEFLNDILLGAYSGAEGIAFTRSRPYHKNDQAWVEQKNGSVVRRFVGYHRLEGSNAVEALARLYSATRLFVNFFQPSFKLKEKVRTGTRILKRYHAAETPTARPLASDAVSSEIKARLDEITSKLDPLQLLDEIRRAQPHRAYRRRRGLARYTSSTRRSLALSRKPFHGVASRRSTAHSSIGGEIAPALADADRSVRVWLESSVRVVGG